MFSKTLLVALVYVSLALGAQAAPVAASSCDAAKTVTVTVTAAAGSSTSDGHHHHHHNGSSDSHNGASETTSAGNSKSTSTSSNANKGSHSSSSSSKGGSSSKSSGSSSKGITSGNSKSNSTSSDNTSSSSKASSGSGSISSNSSSSASSSDASGLQSSFTLDPSVIAPGFAQNGQAVQEAGQVPSITSTNNFINFCATTNQPITNGQQIKTGSCNPAPIGQIPATTEMPSSKFQFPANFGTVPANQAFTIVMAIQNLQTGFFVNAQTNYFSAPQQLNTQGVIQGHSHVVIEQIDSITQTAPTDPTKFAFFLGLNAAATNGVLTAAVTKGLPAGSFKLTSINTAANHQPVIVPVAQHGHLDDVIYFTVVDGTAAANQTSSIASNGTSSSTAGASTTPILSASESATKGVSSTPILSASKSATKGASSTPILSVSKSATKSVFSTSILSASKSAASSSVAESSAAASSVANGASSSSVPAVKDAATATSAAEATGKA